MHNGRVILSPWPSTTSYFVLCAVLLVLTFTQPAVGFENITIPPLDCSAIDSCGECVMHIECGFCVIDETCVNGGWSGPLSNPNLCPTDRWEYQFGQCFVTHKQAMISLTSAVIGILVVLLMLCLCCCLCRCCRRTRGSGTDEERNPLLGGDTVATHHFRRASFFNYNRNRPFERRGRTLSTGTANSAMQYGRNWRANDEFFGYGVQQVPWNDQNPSASSVDYLVPQGSTYATSDWRRWEKKREELLAKYGKSSEG